MRPCGGQLGISYRILEKIESFDQFNWLLNSMELEPNNCLHNKRLKFAFKNFSGQIYERLEKEIPQLSISLNQYNINQLAVKGKDHLLFYKYKT